MPNIYLIYWARLTDSPPSAPGSMTILVRCFEDDPYIVTVYLFDALVDMSFHQWFKFFVKYGLKTENVHRSANDPDLIYTLYSVPFDRAEEVLKKLKAWYDDESTEPLF